MEDFIPSNLAKKCFANTVNSFYAVKGLKNTQEEYEMLCNRIKILRINDEKNMKKIQNNQIQIQKIQRIRNETNLTHQNFNELKKARNENLQLLKRKNKDLKDSIVQKTRVNLQNLVFKRIENHEYITRQTNDNHRKIQIFKLESVNQHRAKYMAVAESEQKLKEKKKSFLIEKKRSVHGQQEKQNEKFRVQKTQKRDQIQNLERLQLQMMKKQSQSHVAYKNVRNKLDEMMGKLQKQRNTSKKKDVQTQNSNGKSLSFYVCNKKNN